MFNPEEELSALKNTYEQRLTTSVRWLNLAQLNASKAVLGQIYASHLSGCFKEDHVLTHNGIALASALIAGAGYITAAVAAEDIATETRLISLSNGRPVPEWALRDKE
jgi:hypothetical protein